ncbi:MAG: T9SS type A sorting domain-containing protein [Bacteroidia bacterium]
MSKGKIFISAAIVFILAIASFLLFTNNPFTLKKQVSLGTEIGTAEDPYARQNWEYARMASPKTGEIPNNIFAREAEFIKSIPYNKSITANKKAADWQQRGPHNIGGRTRAIAIDIDNSDIILAGSVTGGIYRSENGGTTWNRAETPGIMLSVTDIIQDSRANKHNVWYASTGEIIGNLTRYPGDGIYKSTDGGKTWKGLQIEGKPQEFRHINYAWRMVLDHTRNDSDVMYLASFGALLRSNDGGLNWNIVLGGKRNSAYRVGADIAITSTGVLYATLSSNTPNDGDGIWRSENGINWTQIKPFLWPATHGRSVIEIFKGNENFVYFLGYTPNKGKLGQSHAGSSERNSFWKYEYISGNGADTLGNWTDLSDQIPDLGQSDGYIWGDFMSQGGYNLVCRVHPTNQDSIIIGGTNLYVSTDGFKTSNNTSWVGGYLKTKDRVNAFYNGLVYPNHHPDQHNIIFHPDNFNKAFSTNDGGIQTTENIWDQSKDVEWTNLSNGYYTTQFYTITLNQNPDQSHSLSDIMLGGFQDNETQYVNANAQSDAEWIRMACCDGSYSSIFDDDDYTWVVASKQLGTMYLYKFDKDGERLGATRIDPTGGANYLFINPFISNPNLPEKIYLAGGNFIWKNRNVTTIPLSGANNTIDWNWERIVDSRTTTGFITALDCSNSKPANVLYYGNSGGDLYKIDNIETDDEYVITELTETGNPLDGNGNISSIAIDPINANAVLLCFSNYDRKSIYFTNDGGQTWRDVSGNLEENSDGSGAGPGCNIVKIIRDQENKPIYLVGTTAGLFSTTGLPGTATIWNKEGNDEINNCSVRDIDYRSIDNLLVVGTHGCGSFSTNLSNITSIPKSSSISFSVYPNPAKSHITVNSENEIESLQILNTNGQVVINSTPFANNTPISIADLKKGLYLIKAQTKKGVQTTQFLKH